MTAAAPSTGRPAKPRTSWRVPVAVAVFLAITYWAASDRYGIGFSLTEVIQNLSNAGGIVREFLSPRWGVLDNTIDPFLETLRMALIGAAIGCSLALVVAFLASRVTAPNRVTYLLDKAFLNVVRSMPDVLLALLFVAAVSIGALPGILALIIFNIGVVAKLLSETIDGVDTGPIEASVASGASRFGMMRTSVLPQVLPNYVAYSLYTFELNLRASVVLGLVGAGGIGRLIDLYRQRFLYDALAVVILEIFVVVFVVELISIAIRRRLV